MAGVLIAVCEFQDFMNFDRFRGFGQNQAILFRSTRTRSPHKIRFHQF